MLDRLYYINLSNYLKAITVKNVEDVKQGVFHKTANVYTCAAGLYTSYQLTVTISRINI